MWHASNTSGNHYATSGLKGGTAVGFRLKRWVVVLNLAAIITPTDGIFADDRTSFIVDMTHAFYAKVYCSDIDIVYDGFVTAAKSNKLDPAIVEEVRNGVVFLNTSGQMGKRPSKDVLDTITLAAKMIAVDNNASGVEAWCTHRIKFLREQGFVTVTAAAPTMAEVHRRIDEQFSEMRKAMPMQVSALSKLTNASRAGMTLNYSYQDKLPADKWTEAGKRKLLAETIKSQCEGKNTRLLLDLGYSMAALHFDDDARFIAQLYIDKSKCE
jgi:hypothetical protein